jgi:hypothetical protein
MINKNLYSFIKNGETGLFKKDNEVTAYILIQYEKLQDFAYLVGKEVLRKDAYKAEFTDCYVVVYLNDLLVDMGYELSDFKDCFDVEKWKYYFGGK